MTPERIYPAPCFPLERERDLSKLQVEDRVQVIAPKGARPRLFALCSHARSGESVVWRLWGDWT